MALPFAFFRLCDLQYILSLVKNRESSVFGYQKGKTYFWTLLFCIFVKNTIYAI